MNIGLTYDLQTDPADEHQAEFDSPATLNALQGALESLGHCVVRLGNAQQLLADRAQLDRVDLVFNIAEGRSGRCREAWVPTLLEHWGIPFVGSGAVTQALALDKVMTKRLAHASGIPTPRGISLEAPVSLAQLADLSFPLIVKPRYEGSGLGVDRNAVAHDLSSLNRRIAWALARFQQPCVVEEFIPFGEFTVLLIGNHPPRALPVIQRPIDPESRLSCHVVGSSTRHWLSPVDLTPALEIAAQALAVATSETLGCRDMARVDLRVDDQGRLYLLEINPLPSFDPDGSVGLLAEYLGIPYAVLVGDILDASLRRIGASRTSHPGRPLCVRRDAQ